MNRLFLILVTLMMLSSGMFAGGTEKISKPFVPDPKFRVEYDDYEKTLLFVSGFSYALATSQAVSESTTKEAWHCVDSELLNSKSIIDIANEKLKGVVTAENFSLVVLDGLIKKSGLCIYR